MTLIFSIAGRILAALLLLGLILALASSTTTKGAPQGRPFTLPVLPTPGLASRPS